jgi:hypothetical protein
VKVFTLTPLYYFSPPMLYSGIVHRTSDSSNFLMQYLKEVSAYKRVIKD